MPDLVDLVRRHTSLADADLDWLHLLVGEWQLLADLSFADLLLWVRTADAPGFVLVAQIRPVTAQTAYVLDMVGQVIADGKRVLVDRVWPRGMRKEQAHLDEWLRDVAPSTELRRWYGHEPSRFPEFRRRYRAELRDAGHGQPVRQLRDLAEHDKLTLLTATKDVDHSQAAVLAEWLAGSGRAAA